MNVVVMIEGREAIPVRAIPLLTDWEVLSPDALAGALTGDCTHHRSFEKLTAYRSENGHLKDVKPRWWSNFPVRQLEALSHRIKHTEISHDDGHDQWRYKSLPVLPPGVFVWKDEFEACFWSAYGPDGETEWVPVEGGFKMRPRKEFIELDFEPLALPELLALVMEGFEPPATTPSSTPEPQAAPVVADSAPCDVELDQTGPLLKLEDPIPSLAPSWDEDYPRLWHALRLDEERMKTAIEDLDRSRPTSSTEVVSRKENLEAWRAELAQIHKRMDFIGSGVNVEVMHAAEIGYVIGEMTNSRPRACEIDVHQQDVEIKDANKKVDALIAEATTPSPVPEPQAVPVVAVGESSNVVTDKAGPAPLTTNEIANCFAGFRKWDVKRWKSELGSPDNWLKACQHCKGTRGRGGYESTWWPVKIAVALANQDPKSAHHLRARFKRMAQLNPWLDELEINIPDNSDIP